MKKLQSIFIHQEYSRRQKQISCMALIVLSALLYWPTLQFGFVLDDKKVITENAVTQGGADSLNTIWASGSKTFQANVPDDAKIARPLSQTYFALCFDKNLSTEALQKRYHRGQIALYALLVFLLFFLLDKYFDHLSLGLRCIVLALFIAHPLHVEVVANIKSADELLASILLVSSLLALPYSTTSSTHHPAYRVCLIMLSLFLFFLGYKAKQNILMFSPLLIALLFLEIYKTLPKAIQEHGYSYRWYYGLPMVVVLLTILFYKGPDNVPLVQIYALDFEVYQTIQSTYSKAHNTFLGMVSTGEIVANSLWTTYLSVTKMIWPRNLIHQYGAYQIPLTSWQSIKPFCGIGLGGILIGSIYWLSKGPRQFQRVMISAALFTLPLIAYSHLFIPLPDTYADRFFFLAVLGMLLLSAEAISKTSLKPVWIIGLTALGLTAYSSKVIQRMPAWESDTALLTADWKQSPNNASILARYARHVEEDDDKKEQLYLEALSIYPDFFGAHYDLARLYFSQDRYALAYKHFNQANEQKSSDDIQYNLTLCSYHIVRNKSQSAYASNQLDDAIQLLDSALKIFPGERTTSLYQMNAFKLLNYKSELAYNQNDLPTAITMLDSALDIFPGERTTSLYQMNAFDLLKLKSELTYNQDDLPTAITMLDSALKIFPGSKVNNEYRLKTTTLAQMHFAQGAKEKAYKLLINALEQDTSYLAYVELGIKMASLAENPSKAVEFGLYLAPSRADDATYWTDLENLAQGDEILLEQIERRKTEILSVR